MKQLLDVNVWFALAIDTHPHHQAARQWYSTAKLAPGDLLFCLPTEMGLLRLLTQRAVMHGYNKQPLSNKDAAKVVEAMYSDTAVSFAVEPEAVRALWLEMGVDNQSAPLRWMDAYLAALAITLGAELVTFDRGFEGWRGKGLLLRLLTEP